MIDTVEALEQKLNEACEFSIKNRYTIWPLTHKPYGAPNFKPACDPMGALLYHSNNNVIINRMYLYPTLKEVEHLFSSREIISQFNLGFGGYFIQNKDEIRNTPGFILGQKYLKKYYIDVILKP